MAHMNVAFCVNEGYCSYVAVVLISILENHQKDFFDFYVFSSDFSKRSEEKLNKLHLKYKNYAIHVVDVDASRFKDLKLNIDYISLETYYRYIIADVLPDLDKILYLDADLIVSGNIRSFYEMDLGGAYFAGVQDLWLTSMHYEQEIGTSNYINAGVLLMNLRQMREDHLAETLIATTIQLKDKIKYQDQDVLNIVAANKIISVDSIYNFTTHNIKREKSKRKDARILHFTGALKPWHQTEWATKRKKMHTIWQKYQKMTERLLARKIKVGLLIDEFFGGAGTAFGGYGFLARKYIAKYIPNEDIQIDVLLGRGRRNRFFAKKYHVDDVDLYHLPRRAFASRLWLKKQKYDLYLSIELTFDWVLENEPDLNKKMILWIQDPRPKYEWDEINTVKLFKETNYYNQRIYDMVHNWNKQGRIQFISQGYFLNPKAKDLYQLPENTSIQYLPNPVDIDEKFDVVTYPKKKSIIFLGRIESVKRGWLFCEIAKQLPEYEFYVLGQTFREKEKNNSVMAQYQNVPNLHFMGHVDGEEKIQYLKDAKILVNTSIHEALPVSFLEALAYGVCLVSNRNPEELTQKFGIWTGQINGDGFEYVSLYVDAVKRLMTDETLRKKLSVEGRAYVEQVHNVQTFTKDLIATIYENIK